MGKFSIIDKLKARRKARYDRKTEELEDSLSKDGSFDPNQVDSRALFQRIQAQIREEEEHKRKHGLGRMKVRISRQRVERLAMGFIIMVSGIFLASMTSEANRSYVNDTVRYWMGNEVVADDGNENGKDDIAARGEEQKIKEEIEDELGIPVPDFRYMPEITIGNSYSIHDSVVTIEYLYNDIIVNLRMFDKNRTDMSAIDFQGKIIEDLNIRKGLFDIVVLEINDPEDEKVTLAAQWEYQNGYYQLSGKVEKDKFLKILESICY